jgi:hypothetical protein
MVMLTATAQRAYRIVHCQPALTASTVVHVLVRPAASAHSTVSPDRPHQVNPHIAGQFGL